MTIKALIFDKDGTLFDFQATWGVWTGTVIDTLSDGDAEVAHKIASAIDYDLITRKVGSKSVVVAGTPMEIAVVIADVLKRDDVEGLFASLNAMALTAPQKAVTDLAIYFQGLRAKGLKLAVMTNDAEAPAKAHLEKAGCLSELDMVVGSDSGYGAKPDPDPILAIASALNIEPKDVVMVGDSLHDLHAGRAAGVQTIGVLTGLATANTLSPAADVVLADITGIPAWLDNQP